MNVCLAPMMLHAAALLLAAPAVSGLITVPQIFSDGSTLPRLLRCACSLAHARRTPRYSGTKDAVGASRASGGKKETAR